MKELKSHYAEHRNRRIADLFDSDPNRFSNFSAKFENILFDYSKTNIDSDTLSLLFNFLEQSNFPTHRQSLFDGKPINKTENRPVQHMHSRSPENPDIESLCNFADSLNYTDIVHIGIGGSHLGPAMAVRALSHLHNGPNIHFVSNIDSFSLGSVLKKLEGTTPLFIIASKTFTTTETMTNAQSIKEKFGTENFVAICSDTKKAEDFGISPNRIFTIPESVGGRYSIWSSIGLPLLLSIGSSHFRDFLLGGHSIDNHFLTTESDSNIPILQALISFWHRVICGYSSNAILPYDERLSLFPSYLQQLLMESNGKTVSLSGESLTHPTSAIIWGDVGTSSQHSFHQFLHQGSDIVPIDFFIPVTSSFPMGDHHEQLVSNALAQSESLMLGKADESAPHKNFAGNRPSVTFLYPDLTPYILGQLIALFEHKTFVEGILYGINSFDQWGVEYGKSLSSTILPAVKDSTKSVSKYSSGILEAFRSMRHN